MNDALTATRALQRLVAAGALRRVDAEFAELLQARLSASPEVALAGALAMRAVALGHSGFALAQADALIAELEAEVALPCAEAWSRALGDSPCVAMQARSELATPLVFEHGRVALRRYARYEQALADNLLARARAPATAIEPAWLESRLHALLGPDAAASAQAQAVASAMRHCLTLVTGGPGTGKTTTVARILAVLHEHALRMQHPLPRIALAAPTGRAAARLGEAIDATLRRDAGAGRIAAEVAAPLPRDAQTLHRLLGWQSGRPGFRHDAAHRLPFDVVVVDEASMVDLPMMSKLADAVAPDAKLILIGDPDQLPAVEAGDVLGALAQAATAGGPLQPQRVHLQHGYRQAGAAGLQAFARAVQCGDSQAALVQLHRGDAALSLHGGSARALADRLRTQVLPQFAAVRDAADAATALRLAARVRVLTALREGPFGARAWNAWCAEQLGARTPFFHGRLLMITANSYRHGLFNGDTGVVWHDADDEAVVWFDSGNGLQAWRPGQLPAHDSAFATTVHKAQGCEFDRIALVLPDHDARVLTRELLYTGLTRARDEVLLWASPEILATAIARRTRRDSGLLDRLSASA